MASDLMACAHETILSTDPTAELQKLKDAGVKGVRIGAVWQLVEATKGQFTGYGASGAGLPQGFEAVDLAVHAALGLGLTVSLLLNTPLPYWATQDSYTDWGNFCKQAALRYGPLGVKQYEIGNEWNVGINWNAGSWFRQGGYVPGQIAQFTKSASTSIKAVIPGAVIVSCGMAAVIDWPNGWFSAGPSSRSPSGMVSDLLAAGCGPYIDKIGYHPYTIASDFTTFQPPTTTHPMLVEILNIHNQLNQYGFGDKKIEATEWGYSCADFSEDQQAQYYQELWDILHSSTYAPYLANHFTYCGQNFTYPGQVYSATDREMNYGMFRIDGTPKPSVAVISKW